MQLPECEDPLIVNYQIDPTKCCCCPRTTAGASINIRVYANCQPIVYGRHTDYTDTGIPIIATDTCPVAEGSTDCTTLTCGLTAYLTALDAACLCMEGRYNLSYITNQWEKTKSPVCGLSVTINLLCLGVVTEDTGTGTAECLDVTPHAEPDTGTGSITRIPRFLRYQLTVICGADNTGFAIADINVEDVEDFALGFDVQMNSGGGSPCTGDCIWQWNEMPRSWTNIDNPCTGDCTCAEPPGNGISGAGMGIADMETVTTPCTSTAPAICCNGRIRICVYRDCGTGT